MNSSDSSAVPAASQGRGTPVWRHPVAILIVVCALLALALIRTIALPIGPMYWDHFLYIDAANRIFSGQVPAVDFIAPAGALGYYLFTALIALFPQGHALLIASWCLLLVSAPLLAVVLADVHKRSPATAFALLVPFLFYSVLPFNTGDFYPFPGSDGFGIYNRQICQLLYVLTAGLVFLRETRQLAMFVALAMLALLFIKVTGIVAGVVLCLMAFGAGRLRLRAALAAGGLFFAALALIELTTGIVSAYAEDMISLAEINEGSFLPRLLQAASLNFGLSFAGAGLCVILLYQDAGVIRDRLRALCAKPGSATFSSAIDQRPVWVAAFLAAGLLFESQNTGSQALIFLWPLLLSLLLDAYRRDGATVRFALVAVAVAALSAPPAMAVVQKAARAWVGAFQNVELQHDNLKTLGAANVRHFFALRAERLEKIYQTTPARETFEAFADNGEMPNFLLFSDFDFQALWLKTNNDAVAAVKSYEADHAVRFETVLNVDFTNIFPWVLDRRAPLHVAIGADPFRAIPPLDGRARTALANVDLALYPTCPATTTRHALLALYGPVLTQTHTRIPLTPCFDAFIRNALVPSP